MTKYSPVLKAFSLLGPEEILELSEVMGKVPVGKKVAVDILVFFEEDEVPVMKKPKKEAKVLPFTKPKLEPLEAVSPAPKEGDPQENSELPSLVTGEMALFQRELGKEGDEALSRIDAKKGYSRITNVYLVKSKDLSGKEKIRFADTNGVLINKKQA